MKLEGKSMKPFESIKKIKEIQGRFALSLFPAVLLILAGVLGPQCSAMSNPLQGKTAPAFSLRLLDGGMFNLSEHLGKRPVILDFWAVWCPSCRAALPKVASAANAFKDKDVVILTVNLGDSPESIASFLKSNSLNVAVALDGDNTAGKAYHVRSIPTTVFIDREGKVASVTVGALSESALSSAINQLL